MASERLKIILTGRVQRQPNRSQQRKNEDDFEAKGYGKLATYNSEKGRGIMHTPEWVAHMEFLQECFNKEYSEMVIQQRTM